MIRNKYGEIAKIKEVSDGVVFLKVKVKGELLGGYYPDQTKSFTVIPERAISGRFLKTSPDAVSGIRTLDKASILAGSAFNRFVSTEQYGNFVVGPTAFTAHPESIRIGGVFRLNGLLTSTVPSTIVTPVSTLKLDLPGQTIINVLKDIQKDFEGLFGL